MSLDVSLIIKGASIQRESSGIFVRDGGMTRELTEQEWKERFPDREPVRFQRTEPSDEVYNANITHNLGKMAKEAGIYKALWRPKEISVSRAEQLVPILASGLERLKADPRRFKKLDPPNRWGDYDGLVRFLASYLSACIKFPEAEVSVSR